MENVQPDLNSQEIPSPDRFDFQGFLKVFQNYLLESSKQDRHKECSDTPTLTDQPSDSPLSKEGNILKDLLTQLCMSVSDMLQELLDTQGNSIDNKKANKYGNIEEIIEALLLLVTAIRTSPHNLICCAKHRRQLLSIFDWPESLLHKLIQYLVPRTTSEYKFDKLLMRLLEVILNPPKDLGSSKAWLCLAREIETKLVLEDADVCRFLSRIFVLLSPQAKTRIGVSLLDYLKQIMYDDDTQDLVSNEMLNLVYIMSFDPKVQKSLISDSFQHKLLDWLLTSIDENTGICGENFNERNNIITHILINLFQSCERSDMKEFITEMLNRGLSRYPNNMMLKGSSKIFSTLLTSTGFNSFIPVCVHFGNELGNRESLTLIKDIQNNGFLKGINGLNQKHKQHVLNKIQSLQPGYKDLRLESFDFLSKSLDISQEYTIKDLQADGPKLLTFQYLLNNKLVTLGVYMGSGSKSISLRSLSRQIDDKDFFFCCIENEDISIFQGNFTIDIEQKQGEMLEVRFGKYNYVPKVNWRIQIYSDRDINHRIYLVDYSYNEGLRVSHLTIATHSKAYGNEIYEKPFTYQASLEPVKMWLGTPSVDFTKLQLEYGIYNDSAVNTSVNTMFEMYRPGKKIIYVPKELTVKEMLNVLYKDNESVANVMQVHYQQNIVSHDTKIVDIDASIRDQNPFQMLDLTFSSWMSENTQKRMLPPQQVYNNILIEYSTKLQKPLAKYLMNNGGPLDFLKSVSIGNMNETTFHLMQIYLKIVEIAGPYIDMLSSIMKEDLVIVLWHILFSGCTSDFMLEGVLFTLLLGNLTYANLIASDPKQLYQFFSTATSSLLLDEKTRIKFPGLDVEVNAFLMNLLEAELIQNPKYIRKLIEAVLEKDGYLIQSFFILHDDYDRNNNFHEKIEDMLTKGINLIATCCKDKKFNNNYLCMSQATLAFAKMKGYLSALEQDESFENGLQSLIMIFEDVRDSNGSISEANNKMEYKLLEIIDCVYGKMAEVMQHKRDLSPENNLVAISDACCGVFNFVQNELETLEKEQDRFLSFDMILEILNSGSIILKKMIDNSAMNTLGLDAVNQFYYQYLSGMEAMGISWTIARILGLMRLITDENLFIGMVTPIFELLDLWSVHPVLSKLLDHEVGDDGVSLFKCCFEFAKEIENDLKEEDDKEDFESPLKKKNKELRLNTLKLLKKFKITCFEKKVVDSY